MRHVLQKSSLCFEMFFLIFSKLTNKILIFTPFLPFHPLSKALT